MYMLPCWLRIGLAGVVGGAFTGRAAGAAAGEPVGDTGGSPSGSSTTRRLPGKAGMAGAHAS